MCVNTVVSDTMIYTGGSVIRDQSRMRVNHQTVQKMRVNHQTVQKMRVNHQTVQKMRVNHQTVQKMRVNHQTVQKNYLISDGKLKISVMNETLL